MDQRLLIGLHSDLLGLRRAAQRLRDCIAALNDYYHRSRIDYYELGDQEALAIYEADEAKNFEHIYAAELRDIHLAVLALHDIAAEGGAIRKVLDAEWRKLDDPLSNCDLAVGRVTGITEYVAREARQGRMNAVSSWNDCDEQLANLIHLIDGALARIEAIPTVDEHLSRESIDWLRGLAGVGAPAPVKNAASNASANGGEREAAVDGLDDGPEAGELEHALPALASKAVVTDAAQAKIETRPESNGEKIGETRRRQRTPRGGTRAKFVAALTAHHGYENGSIGNREPITVEALAKAAGISTGSVSTNLNAEFKGHGGYVASCRRGDTLARQLKLMNGEIRAHVFLQDANQVADERGDQRDE